MDIAVALPIKMQPPPTGKAMILGREGLEKLQLEISLHKNYLYPRPPGPRGFIL